MPGDRDVIIEFPAPRPRSGMVRSKRNHGSDRISLFAAFMLACAVLLIAQRRRATLVMRFSDMDVERTPQLSYIHSTLLSLGNKTAVAVLGRTAPKTPLKVHQRNLDRRGVPEAFTTIRQDWKGVVTTFLDDAPLDLFAARKLRQYFYSNTNNIQDSCMLVTIKNGNVTFTEEYEENRHSRASSVKYIVGKIVKERGTSLPGATFLVMVTDGNRPQVPIFGSARHWKSWKLMTPVPLGNSRGEKLGWGTPFEGWDAYIDRTITDTHASYPWNSKEERAVFRGSLGMQTYKLGSCNEENDGQCEPAKSWREVNRGVMYEKASARPELFEVAFTQHKAKKNAPSTQFDGAPDPGESIKFQDYQKHKYILNVGSNQDWAERLRSLLYMNSAVIVHMAETQEFYTPLMKPWVHFIPTSLHFDDLVKNVEWAIENDLFTQQIVRNQNSFADRYITERAMQQYWEVALEEFSGRQAKAAAGGSGSKY